MLLTVSGVRASLDASPRNARIISEPSTAVAEFQSGNVDVLQVPQGEIRDWEEDTERKKLLASTPALELVYVAINTTRGPLADVRVRQAFAVDPWSAYELERLSRSPTLRQHRPFEHHRTRIHDGRIERRHVG